MSYYSGENQSLCSDSPPPSYTTDQRPTSSKSPRRAKSGAQIQRSSLGFLLGTFLGLLLFLIIVFQIVIIAGRPENLPDAVERERIRHEWEKEKRGWSVERQHWEVERSRLRSDWEDERRRYNIEKSQWDRERRRYKEDIARLIEERKRALGGTWQKPQGAQCLAYGVRDYTVSLDAHAVCEIAPVVVGDDVIMPQGCEAQDGRVIGHFTRPNYDDRECHPYWGGLYDKGCVYRGRDYGIRRYEAQLQGIRNGDDGYRMCDTTPANVRGHRFSNPTRCEDRGIWYGMVGMFEYNDPTCQWEHLLNATEAANETTSSA